MPTGARASRSVQSSAGAPVQGSTTPQLRNRHSGGLGFYARQAVAAYGYSFSIFSIIESVQAESAPEDWYIVLQERIDRSTPKFISALVSGMRKDRGLPPLPE